MSANTRAFEESIEHIGYLTLSLDHWDEISRELLAVAGTPDGYEKWVLALVVRRAVERAAVRTVREAGLPLEVYPLNDHEDMGRHADKLPAALEMVSGDYRDVLPEVKNARLLDALMLDASRKALQYEIGLLSGSQSAAVQG